MSPWPIECRTPLYPPPQGGRNWCCLRTHRQMKTVIELSSGRRIRVSSKAIDVFGVYTTDRQRSYTSHCRGIGDYSQQRALDHSSCMIKPAD
jgi:hypothetical protein